MSYQNSRRSVPSHNNYEIGGSAISSYLPGQGALRESWKPYDTYPAPSPLRRYQSTLPWSPSVHCSTAQGSRNVPNVKQVLEEMSRDNHLGQGDHHLSLPVRASNPRKLPSFSTSLYTRYTPTDWLRHKNSISADQVRVASEGLRNLSYHLTSELDEKTKRTTADVDKKLGSRIGDIEFWRSELDNETSSLLDETQKLRKAKEALELFLKESHRQIELAQECLYQREKRHGIDLVHDAVEQALLAEIELTKQSQQLAEIQLNKVNCQIEMNRAAQHEMEKDSKDKHVSAAIDYNVQCTAESSRGVASYKGIELVDNTVSVPETWADFTNNNVRHSHTQRNVSINLRNDIQTFLRQASDSLWKQWNKVNIELVRRKQETIDARNKIERHLSGTLQEIFDTEKSIELLKKSMNDKYAPRKLASTRLEGRLRRPNMEACRDTGQHRLVQQIYEIDETIESLNSQIRRVEDQLQALLRKKSQLEADLTTKNYTLYIDGEVCAGLRKVYPKQDRVWTLI